MDNYDGFGQCLEGIFQASLKCATNTFHTELPSLFFNVFCVSEPSKSACVSEWDDYCCICSENEIFSENEVVQTDIENISVATCLGAQEYLLSNPGDCDLRILWSNCCRKIKHYKQNFVKNIYIFRTFWGDIRQK